MHLRIWAQRRTHFVHMLIAAGSRGARCSAAVVRYHRVSRPFLHALTCVAAGTATPTLLLPRIATKKQNARRHLVNTRIDGVMDGRQLPLTTGTADVLLYKIPPWAFLRFCHVLEGERSTMPNWPHRTLLTVASSSVYFLCCVM
jgi:hypothetical protein